MREEIDKIGLGRRINTLVYSDKTVRRRGRKLPGNLGEMITSSCLSQEVGRFFIPNILQQ